MNKVRWQHSEDWVGSVSTVLCANPDHNNNNWCGNWNWQFYCQNKFGVVVFDSACMTCLPQYKRDRRLTIDLLETDSNGGDGSLEGAGDDCQQKWSAYIDSFVTSDTATATEADTQQLTVLGCQQHQPVLLRRSYNTHILLQTKITILIMIVFLAVEWYGDGAGDTNEEFVYQWNSYFCN